MPLPMRMNIFSSKIRSLKRYLRSGHLSRRVESFEGVVLQQFNLGHGLADVCRHRPHIISASRVKMLYGSISPDGDGKLCLVSVVVLSKHGDVPSIISFPANGLSSGTIFFSYRKFVY